MALTVGQELALSGIGLSKVQNSKFESGLKGCNEGVCLVKLEGKSVFLLSSLLLSLAYNLNIYRGGVYASISPLAVDKRSGGSAFHPIPIPHSLTCSLIHSTNISRLGGHLTLPELCTWCRKHCGVVFIPGLCFKSACPALCYGAAFPRWSSLPFPSWPHATFPSCWEPYDNAAQTTLGMKGLRSQLPRALQ